MHKGKGFQEIGTIDEALKYKNTRRDFKCCSYRKNWETVCQSTPKSTVYQGPEGAFSDKVVPDVDDVTNELMWCSSCKKILL